MFKALYELKNSDSFALHHADEHMTYRELFKRSQAIACFLCEQTDLNKTVGIYGDKENDVVASFVGAVMAGKVYVMLPVSYPVDRINKIVSDCKPDVIFNISDRKLEIDGVKIIDGKTIKSEWSDKYKDKEIIEMSDRNPDDLAVILYTSGTTGNPHGVEITFRNIQSQIDALLTYEVYEIGKEKKSWREMGLASYSFSMGLLFYGILGVFGGEYFSVPTEIIVDTRSLLAYLIEVQPYGFTLTPSLVKSLLSLEDFCSDKLYDMRLLCLGGEPLAKDVAESLLERFPNIKMANCYGLTETAGSFVCCELTEDAIISTERFMPVSDCNTDCAFLLDKNGNIIKAENEVGEICFAGDMVTKGYYNDIESTQNSYFAMSDGRKAFHTGDMGIIKNGYMFLMHRSDNMVKIGGNRVEIEDVEKHLLNCKPVTECAVAVKTDSQGNNSLVGYIVRSKEYQDSDDLDVYFEIQDEMMSAVEPYKIPKKIVSLEELPKNTNGKLDRNELSRRANN